MTRIDAFVDQHKWKIIAAVISAVIAITTAKAQLDGKAEKSDVQRLNAKMDNVIYLLCRAPENRSDSVCK